MAHAARIAALLGPPPGPFLDLGTGAGIPGLVLALAWPGSTGAMLDSRAVRMEFLAETLQTLGLSGRFRARAARAEDAARDPELRGQFALVVARGFGAPAVTAECAVAFLAPGGHLAVSEPPDSTPESRWPTEHLAQLNLAKPAILKANGTTIAHLQLTAEPNNKWPRRPGIPTKRPLW